MTLLALGLVALATFALAELWRRWALHRGLLDVPGHRSSHVVATPRGAGVGIVVAVLVAALLLVPASAERDAALLSIGLAGLLGLVDDLRPLSPALKLAGQAFAALPLAIALPPTLPFALPPLLAHSAAVALALLYVNAWNFMDGIDGIAASAAAAVCAGVWFASAGQGGISAALAPLLLAACVGFLPINLPKARAFMGDCGSHALGMGLAAMVLGAPSIAAGAVALAASAAFLVDVLGTLVMRARDGERLASAHRRHLYQLVTRSGYSHVRVTTAYVAWMLASGGVVAMAQSVGGGGVAAMAVIAVTTVAWWHLHRRFEAIVGRAGTP
jgi:UDP-N-acetylmuramyl pentapeptide phosphotransferase/UDP-N-acetylglucosamine-1-phosphate transferase